MTKSYKALLGNIMQNAQALGKNIPEVAQGAFSLGQNAVTDGTLDAKTKELIALALGVGAKCEGCIAQHSMALVSLGATEKEVHEALGVAIAMGGGPAVTYASYAVEAFKEFSEGK